MKNVTYSAIDNSNSLSEQQAITLLKQGNIKGLSTLVQNYQVKAVHSALLITCNLDLAEDVVQDAYLQAYRKITQFDDSRPFSPWFFRIVINAAKKAVLRQRKFQPVEEFEGEDSIKEWLIDPSQSPEKLTESAETRELIWKAIEKLTPNQRAVIVLRYFLEKDEREMIQNLSRPSASIKWWLHVARQRLRRLLQPDGVTEPVKKEANNE